MVPFANDRYSAMQYRRSGGSGLRFSALSLGFWNNFGGTDDPKNAADLVHRAFDRGITYFDLANGYGPPGGAAELTLGRILSGELGAYRDELLIATKAGFRLMHGPYGEGGSRKALITSLDRSLKRMGLEYVDIFYSHRYDADTPLEETCAAMDYIVRTGRALYLGISNYDVAKSIEMRRILQSLGSPLTVIQANYSLFRRDIEGGLLRAPELEDVGIVAYSPLAQGLLTSRYLESVPKDSRAARREGTLPESAVTQAAIDKARALNELAKANNRTLAQMALAWVLGNARISSALIGVSRVGQLDENIAGLSLGPLSDAERAAIDSVLRKG